MKLPLARSRIGSWRKDGPLCRLMLCPCSPASPLRELCQLSENYLSKTLSCIPRQLCQWIRSAGWSKCVSAARIFSVEILRMWLPVENDVTCACTILSSYNYGSSRIWRNFRPQIPFARSLVMASTASRNMDVPWDHHCLPLLLTSTWNGLSNWLWEPTRA